MTRRLPILIAIVALALAAAAPAAAGGGSVQRLTNISTVIAVAFPDDFPVASLMRADCDWLQRVQRPNGSAVETMSCRLTTEPPLMRPENQGQPPTTAFVDAGGACVWTSDYWWTVADVPVHASSYRVVVTPSGRVHIKATYPAQPLVCAD